jgi:hypothetical protein
MPIQMIGERIFDWIERIDEAAALVAWWDLIRFEERGELGKFFQWQGSPERLSIYFEFNGKGLTTDASYHQRYCVITWSDGSEQSEWMRPLMGENAAGNISSPCIRSCADPNMT